jgi:hypothetical protein
MTGASIETTLELWASSLPREGRMRGLFTQERVAASANLFLGGLLGDERRKTGWMRAEAARANLNAQRISVSPRTTVADLNKLPLLLSNISPKRRRIRSDGHQSGGGTRN